MKGNPEKNPSNEKALPGGLRLPLLVRGLASPRPVCLRGVLGARSEEEVLGHGV